MTEGNWQELTSRGQNCYREAWEMMVEREDLKLVMTAESEFQGVNVKRVSGSWQRSSDFEWEAWAWTIDGRRRKRNEMGVETKRELNDDRQDRRRELWA